MNRKEKEKHNFGKEEDSKQSHIFQALSKDIGLEKGLIGLLRQMGSFC